MKVLVTGNRGYIGTVMVPFLIARGHTVCGLDADLFAGCDLAPAPATAAVDTLVKDIRDVEPGDFTDIDAVCHLAALSNDPLGNLDPAITDDINRRGSVRVASAAKAAGVSRFVFASSCSNYGKAGEDLLDEEAQFNPITAYGVSKVAAEGELAGLADDGFVVTALRCATAYGVSPRLRCDIVLNNLVAWAFATGEVLMKSDGTPWRPIVHIQDIAQAFATVLEAPAAAVNGRAFNVGSTAENYRMSELADTVAAAVPGTKVVYAEGGGPDARSYRVNCDRLSATLPAFAPRWTARAGAEELIGAFRAAMPTLTDLEGARYQRILHLKELIAKGAVDAGLRRTAGTPATAR